MRHELELAYVGIQVPDPASLAPFFGDVIGLEPGEPTTDGAATWRDDDRAQRVLVEAGPLGDLAYVALEAVDADAFEVVAQRLRAAGHQLVEGETELAAARRVARLVRVEAPWGTPLELVLGPEAAAQPFASALVPGGFLTDGVGFGHVVIATTAFDESDAFLREGLGFGRSDWLEIELAPGIDLEVRFYHCNGRHHSVALARAPFELPQKLHHLMFEVNDRDDVGAAFDRAWASGLPIPNGLGRHDNDGMFSFYVASPAGFQVEVGHGARTITEDWDDDRRYDQISAWGHQPLRQP
ncbi:VOC family protein [Aquihabitans sp. G128]|uniref:VOC family protein n=1 Tax=Aquihabitans sp. G128 TaxID=2849779 RepID=UPI001C239C4E|nr:VOC family protein [Aquihabitans sp. G128]QXC59663.1 VOC family protein [Aquihabitans sp. G128]